MKKSLLRHLHTIVLLLLSTQFLCTPIAAQTSHPFFLNFNTDHGLPSPEVHYAIQDTAGYMWFGTDNGLAKFNGYEFETFGINEGLDDPVIYYLQLDSKGTLWMAAGNGHLFYNDHGQIKPFEENNQIDSLVEKPYINGFIIDQYDNKYLSYLSQGILEIKKSGVFNHIRTSRNDRISYIVEKNGNHFYARSNYRKEEGELKNSVDFNNRTGFENIWQLEGNKERLLLQRDLKGVKSSHWITPLFEDKVFTFDQRTVYEWKDNSLEYILEVDFNCVKKAILPLTGDQLLIGATEKNGLKFYASEKNFRQNISNPLLPNRSVSQLFQDEDQGLWVSTIENGIYYTSDYQQKIYDQESGLSSAHVSSICHGEKDQMFVGLRNGSVYLLNTATGIIEHLIDNEIRLLFDLIYDSKDKALWMSNGRLNKYINGQWILSKNENRIIDKVLKFNPKTRNLSGGGSASFGVLNLDSDKLEHSSIDLGIIGRNFVVFENSKNEIWLGRKDGLFQLKNKKIVPANSNFPELNTRVDDLAELEDGSLVIATKGNGVLIWNKEKFQKYGKAEGMNSNMIENIHIDEFERIWTGGLQGLNCLTPLPNGGYQVEGFTMNNGLPSNEINKVISKGNEIWVATTRGLIKWQEKTKPSLPASSRLPKVNTLLINGENQSINTLSNLSHAQNNLSIHFEYLDYQQHGKISYRYRMNQDAWTVQNERIANYSKLAPGDYSFELQALNADGTWSQSLIKKISISHPWWAHSAFYLLCALLCVGFVIGLYKYKTRQLKRDFEMKTQLASLEKKALQAQMNPHFIFNCLNSIQYLVIDNNVDDAMRYLSRFAKLVRGTLNASMKGRITLEEEINMLENYLNLEKLRFKEAIQYSIYVEPGLEQLDFDFPPMLLQPFVENAIVHGLKDTKSNGRIEIKFIRKLNQIFAIVSDNGSGIEPKKETVKEYESVGMKLTERRLELLNQPIDQTAVSLKPLTDSNKENKGTEVTVLLGTL